MNLQKLITKVLELQDAIRGIHIPSLLFETAYVVLYLNYPLDKTTLSKLLRLIEYEKALLGITATDNEQHERLLRLLDSLEKLVQYRQQLVTEQEDILDVPHYKDVTPFTSAREVVLTFVSTSELPNNEYELLAKVEPKLVQDIHDYHTLVELLLANVGLLSKLSTTLEKASNKPIREIISELTNELFETHERASEIVSVKVQEELITDLTDLAQIATNDIETLYSLPSLIFELDSVVKGFTPGTVTAFAGTLGTGKSGLLLNIAIGLAVSTGLFSRYIRYFWPEQYRDYHPIVVYITLENSKQLTNFRLLQILTDTSYDTLRSVVDLADYIKQVSEQKQIPLTQLYKQVIKHSGLMIVDAVSVDFGLAELEQKIRELLHARFYPVAIILDYMDEVFVPYHKFGEYRFKFGIVAQGLKALADRYQTIIVTATQLNREAIKYGELSIAHLSESIEHAKRLDFMVGIRSEAIPIPFIHDALSYLQNRERGRKNTPNDSAEITTSTHSPITSEITRVMFYAVIKDRTTGTADNRIRYLLSTPSAKFGFMSQLYASYLYPLCISSTGIIPAIERRLSREGKQLESELLTELQRTAQTIYNRIGFDPLMVPNTLSELLLYTHNSNTGVADMSSLTTQELYKYVREEIPRYLSIDPHEILNLLAQLPETNEQTLQTEVQTELQQNGKPQVDTNTNTPNKPQSLDLDSIIL